MKREILGVMAASLALSMAVPLSGLAASPVKTAPHNTKSSPTAPVPNTSAVQPAEPASSSLANPPSLPLLNLDTLKPAKTGADNSTTHPSQTTSKTTAASKTTATSKPTAASKTTTTSKTSATAKTTTKPKASTTTTTIYSAPDTAKSAEETPATVQTEHVDFLRSIPLEVDGYEAGKAMPEHFTSAEQVMQTINSTPVLLIHMEALRRGYHDLSPTEQDKLLAELLKRRKANENDLMLGFDHGYAQLVYKQNKTGLFFLRKANDKFQNQFSNLAYGMAQVEADINLEGARPDETTTRKMDATYNLGDAVKIDAMKHQPGFWPSYVRVIEKMKPLPAYQSFTRRDFSTAYVPSGSQVVSLGGANTTSIPLTDKPASLFSNALTTSCNPESSPAEADAGTLQSNRAVAQRSANFNGNMALIQFFPTDQNHLYRVRVVDPAGNPMLSFKSYVMPNIVEDIDGDGVQEIVARQYAYNPEQPVLVYRYTPCGFELDKKIFDDFR